ncbi:DUF3014 domain-containing protein [Gilvimarinus sp. F26214L]|uniref:DUF3014 domain-containing protein n=1 Tax=Gilvimarinus sp. DZF01 TaxID=3461371 RepID=UPI004045C835
MANEDSGKNSPYLIKLLLLAAAVVVAIVLLWQMASDEPPEEAPPALSQPETPPPVAPEPEPQPEPEPAQPSPAPEPEPEPEPLPELAQSDEVAIAAAEQLAPSTELREIMVPDNVIPKSVRALIALAGGDVVHEYRPVDSPDTPFVAEKLDEPPTEDQGQRYRLSPENYARYDKYVSVIEAVDPRNLAATYKRFYPLLEEAYAQHGVASGSFKDVTLRAIDSMLAAPVLEDEPILVQPKVHYQFADPELEELPGSQKLLIRMGPENTRKIQRVLREVRAAIEAEDLP